MPEQIQIEPSISPPEQSPTYVSLETHRLPVSRATELRKWLFYVSDEIESFEIIERDGLIHGINIFRSAAKESAPDDAADSSIENKINEVIKTHIISKKQFLSKIIWHSDSKSTASQNIFDLLAEKEIVFEAGEGQVAFGEPLISLMNYFDRRLTAIALSLPNAKEYQYPTLLPTRVLEQCGYFNSFPQFVMFVTRLHNDIDVYQSFMREYESNGKITDGLFEYCRNHEYCLPPTMCYHSYHQHHGKQIERDMVITAKGKSFRFESKYYSGLERLWDFTIREIVFIGSREFVLECRRYFMEQAFSLMNELNLDGFCEVANDPFFVTPTTVGKIYSQRVMELKYELRLTIEPEKTIAVGSFNFHDDFFGRSFNITQEQDKPAASACVGFGLERLVYAFLCQHGLNPDKWSLAL